jgi:hypothetical protein
MDVDGPVTDVTGVSSICCSGDGAFKVVGGLGEVGDAFEVDFLSVEVAFDLDVFLVEALGLGTAGRLLSVSLISPSSRLSSVPEAVAFVGGVAFWSIADGGAVVDEADSSSP